MKFFVNTFMTVLIKSLMIRVTNIGTVKHVSNLKIVTYDRSIFTTTFTAFTNTHTHSVRTRVTTNDLT